MYWKYCIMLRIVFEKNQWRNSQWWQAKPEETLNFMHDNFLDVSVFYFRRALSIHMSTKKVGNIFKEKPFLCSHGYFVRALQTWKHFHMTLFQERKDLFHLFLWNEDLVTSSNLISLPYPSQITTSNSSLKFCQDFAFETVQFRCCRWNFAAEHSTKLACSNCRTTVAQRWMFLCISPDLCFNCRPTVASLQKTIWFFLCICQLK